MDGNNAGISSSSRRYEYGSLSHREMDSFEFEDALDAYQDAVDMLDEDDDGDSIPEHTEPGPLLGQTSKLWSVMDKIQTRHYCRIRSCYDFLHILNCKCFLATAMLAIAVVLGVAFTRMILFQGLASPSSYDFIIVGGGPSGSIVARKLTDAGAKVLLLEAGGPTQHALGGSDNFGGPVTRFDIPLLWSSISHFAEYHWSGFNIPNVLIAKALGGCGIHNAMLYVRALKADLVRWDIPGWSWEKILSVYISLEKFRPDDFEYGFSPSTSSSSSHSNSDGGGSSMAASKVTTSSQQSSNCHTDSSSSISCGVSSSDSMSSGSSKQQSECSSGNADCAFMEKDDVVSGSSDTSAVQAAADRSSTFERMHRDMRPEVVGVTETSTIYKQRNTAQNALYNIEQQQQQQQHSKGSDTGGGDLNQKPSSYFPWFHGKNGPMVTSKPVYIDELAPNFVEAAQRAGVPYTADFNDPAGGRNGVGYYHVAVENGVRASAARSMLRPLLWGQVNNFELQMYATVTRVILAKEKPSTVAKEHLQQQQQKKEEQEQQMATDSEKETKKETEEATGGGGGGRVDNIRRRTSQQSNGASTADLHGKEKTRERKNSSAPTALQEERVKVTGYGGYARPVVNPIDGSLSTAFDGAADADVNAESGFSKVEGGTNRGLYSIKSRFLGESAASAYNFATGKVMRPLNTFLAEIIQVFVYFGLNSRERRRTSPETATAQSDDDTAAGPGNTIMPGEGEVERENGGVPVHYRAAGVEYYQNGQLQYAYLTKGPAIKNSQFSTKFEGIRCIVLTAGAIMTPKILMNSGIGPKKVLKDARIELKVRNEDVGRNLQDHPAVGLRALIRARAAAGYPSMYTLSQEWATYISAINENIAQRRALQSAIDSASSSSSPSSSSVSSSSTGHGSGRRVVSTSVEIDASPGTTSTSSTSFSSLFSSSLFASLSYSNPDQQTPPQTKTQRKTVSSNSQLLEQQQQRQQLWRDDAPLHADQFRVRSSAPAGAGPSKGEGEGGSIGWEKEKGEKEEEEEELPMIPRDKLGVLASIGFTAGAFLCSPYAKNNVPDIQLTAFPSITEPHLLERARSYGNGSIHDFAGSSNQMLITIALLSPEARQKVVLNRTDPFGSVPLLLNGRKVPFVGTTTIRTAADYQKKKVKTNNGKESVDNLNSSSYSSKTADDAAKTLSPPPPTTTAAAAALERSTSSDIGSGGDSEVSSDAADSRRSSSGMRGTAYSSSDRAALAGAPLTAELDDLLDRRPRQHRSDNNVLVATMPFEGEDVGVRDDAQEEIEVREDALPGYDPLQRWGDPLLEREAARFLLLQAQTRKASAESDMRSTGGWSSSSAVSDGKEERVREGDGETAIPREIEARNHVHRPQGQNLEQWREKLEQLEQLEELEDSRALEEFGSANSPGDDDYEAYLNGRQGPELLSRLDALRLMWGLRMSRAILAQEPLVEILGEEVAPGADMQSDEDIIDWINANRFPNSHWVGTARLSSSVPASSYAAASSPSPSPSSNSSPRSSSRPTASKSSTVHSLSSAGSEEALEDTIDSRPLRDQKLGSSVLGRRQQEKEKRQLGRILVKKEGENEEMYDEEGGKDPAVDTEAAAGGGRSEVSGNVVYYADDDSMIEIKTNSTTSSSRGSPSSSDSSSSDKGSGSQQNTQSSSVPTEAPTSGASHSRADGGEIGASADGSGSAGDADADSNGNVDGGGSEGDDGADVMQVLTGGVLDEQLRVKGVHSLMVADASAIPLIPNGNVHSTVTVIASMAADFILAPISKAPSSSSSPSPSS